MLFFDTLISPCGFTKLPKPLYSSVLWLSSSLLPVLGYCQPGVPAVLGRHQL